MKSVGQAHGRGGRRRTAAHILVVVLAVTSCGRADRPSVAEWTAIWESSQALVPDTDTLLDGGSDLCDELVGRAREEFSDLVPTPDELLDAAVDDWRAYAETTVFECPDDRADLARRMSELGVLAAEVDAGLAAQVDG